MTKVLVLVLVLLSLSVTVKTIVYFPGILKVGGALVTTIELVKGPSSIS